MFVNKFTGQQPEQRSFSTAEGSGGRLDVEETGQSDASSLRFESFGNIVSHTRSYNDTRKRQFVYGAPV